MEQKYKQNKTKNIPGKKKIKIEVQNFLSFEWN